MEGFQEVLRAAADIKTAQLKERPGRQEWERSPEWIKYTAFPDKEVVAARKLPLEDRLALCQAIKAEGNAKYEADDPVAALQQYTRALSLFCWFDRGKDRANEDIPWVNSVTKIKEGPDRDQVNTLLASLLNNAASCLLKLDKHEAALHAASKALEHDPHSVKALYRRAVAQRSLGTGEGLDGAVRDLQAAVALEPGNTHVRVALGQYQRELHEQKRKEAAVFGNMFSGQLYKDEHTCKDRHLGHDRHRTQQAAAGSGGAGESDEDNGAEAVQGDGTKGRADVDPAEVARAVHGIQRGMQRAQSRPHRPQPPSEVHELLKPFTMLPWWAWMLIVLHLLYRIAKWGFSSRGLEDDDKLWHVWTETAQQRCKQRSQSFRELDESDEP